LKKGRGSVSSFTDARGVKHFPGDIVDLPSSYEGEVWLEPLDVEPAKPTMREVKPSELKPGPLPEKKPKRPGP
jgi:hypothetical protein